MPAMARQQDLLDAGSLYSSLRGPTRGPYHGEARTAELLSYGNLRQCAVGDRGMHVTALLSA